MSTADLFVYGERADGTPEHEIEERATNARLRAFVGEGWETLTDAECQGIRDAIMTIVGG